MVIATAVVGASGYSGGELLRLLSKHPDMEVALACAGTHAGEFITDVHPGLLDFEDVAFEVTDVARLAELDLVFIALPHGESAAVTELLPDSVKIVDLGADHRLADGRAWDAYYGGGVMAPQWTYGLPELPGRRELIAESSRVANPGCYATAVELSLAPLVASNLIESDAIVVVAASGTSGAGRKASIGLTASEVMGSMTPYKVGGVHQHIAEIEQELSGQAAGPVTVCFTPLLAPMPRGIIATCTAKLTRGVAPEQASEALRGGYRQEPFVRVLRPGRVPSTAATLGSNSAVLQLAVDEHTNQVIVMAAIDNLGKGAAGQAIQNANIMFGLDQTLGLSSIGVAP
ncbi:MAG: N-acetyl-gamma-glutamyl-phosphate reductase [Actinomycetes bacterium]